MRYRPDKEFCIGFRCERDKIILEIKGKRDRYITINKAQDIQKELTEAINNAEEYTYFE